eukprot:TRINITY_DN12910_c0_g1_i1.p1 TRINITY_DN12910_c0_g1~~TRINITY_DN12910_c0_g1_i1.p1  ORF type:complete len:282 (+),score=73.03 TRINITY_DN12910_c0_g1_i1:63-848(+)
MCIRDRIKANPNNLATTLLLAKEANPQILNFDTGKVVWKAKNVPNDYLDLKVPVHDLDAVFHHNAPNTFYTSTAYNKVRLYDIRGKPKPLKDVEIGYEKSPLNNIILSHSGNFIYVSNLIGSIFLLDNRKDFQMVGKLKGATGTIKKLELHPTQPILASASLDRFLRLYNLQTRALIKTFYLKQKLTNCLMIGDEMEEIPEEPEETLGDKVSTRIKVNENRELNQRAKKAGKIKLVFLPEAPANSQDEPAAEKPKKRVKTD